MVRFAFFVLSLMSATLLGQTVRAQPPASTCVDCEDEFSDLDENHPLAHILKGIREDR